MQEEKICPNCGYIGKAKRKSKGSLTMEIMLWTTLVLPGLFYTLWRWGSRYDACRSCGASALVPVDSPVGQRLMKKFYFG